MRGLARHVLAACSILGCAADVEGLLQSALNSDTRSISAHQRSAGIHEHASNRVPDIRTNKEYGDAMTSYVAGEVAEVNDWIRCNISGVGKKPNTYNIVVPAKIGYQEIPDVPIQGLRKADLNGHSSSGGRHAYAIGDQAEVLGWVKCRTLGRGSTLNTYDLLKLIPSGHQRVNGTPVTQLRKIGKPNWLHESDPATPSRIPGQNGGFCSGPEDCAKLLDTCVAEKHQLAQQNCGGRCDAVFVGDSILERLSGRLCYSGGSRWPKSHQVFQDLVAARHPKSMILAGSCDETSQTLHMLDAALPALRAPRAYFVLIGTNNLPKGGAAHALRGIRAVVAKLLGVHPGAHVLLHALLPRGDDKVHVLQAHIDGVNRELAAFVETRRAAGTSIEFVNCTSPLHPYAQRSEHFDNIMLHPSPAGYQAWLSCVSPVLDRALDRIPDSAEEASSLDPA